MRFNITPDEHYEVDTITVDGNSVSRSDSGYVFTNVQSNHSLSVTFRKKRFSITPSWGQNGRINPGSPVLVPYGEDQSFDIIPDTHFTIKDVLVDSVSQLAGIAYAGDTKTGTYHFGNVTSNHTLSASFNLSPICINKDSIGRPIKYQGEEITIWNSTINGSFFWNGVGKVYITGTSDKKPVAADDGFIIRNASGGRYYFINTNWPPRVFSGIADITPLCQPGDNMLTIILKDYWGGSIGMSPAWIYFDQDTLAKMMSELEPEPGIPMENGTLPLPVCPNCTDNRTGSR